MIAGALLLGVANLASGVWAKWLAERLRTGESSLDAVLFLVIRLLLMSAAILVAGLTQQLSGWSLGIVSAGALVLFFVRGGNLSWKGEGWIPWRGWLGVATVLVFLRLALQVWCFAPHLGDAVAYHLPKIAEWVRQGGFTREMGLHPHVTFPAGFELIETWWVVFLHHDVLIEMAGVEFLLLGFMSVRALGHQIGLDRAGAQLAALIFVLTPGFHLSATSCLNDVPAASLVLASAVFVLGRLRIPLLLMTVGLGLGIKATYGYALPGLLLLGFLVRRDPAAQAGSRAWAWGLGTLGLLAGSFWYLRNLAWYGNPVFPVGQPGYLHSAVAVQAGFRWSSFTANLRDLFDERIYDRQTALGANVDNMAGWGPVVFSSGIPALLAVWPGASSRFRRLAVALGISLATTLGLIVHDPWCLKYVFFFPALGALAAAELARTSSSVRGIVVAGLAFSFLVTFLPYDLPVPNLAALWRQGWRDRTALREPEPVKGEPVVACFGGFRARSANLYRPDYSRRVVYLRETRVEPFLDRLRDSGAAVLYGVPGDALQEELLDVCVRRGALRPLGDSFFRVVKRPE